MEEESRKDVKAIHFERLRKLLWSVNNTKSDTKDSNLGWEEDDIPFIYCVLNKSRMVTLWESCFKTRVRDPGHRLQNPIKLR